MKYVIGYKLHPQTTGSDGQALPHAFCVFGPSKTFKSIECCRLNQYERKATRFNSEIEAQAKISTFFKNGEPVVVLPITK